MAKTIATCWGYDRSRVKEDHRLGSVAAAAEVATWHTKIRADINADGSGHLSVVRDGRVLHTWTIRPESDIDPTTLAVT
jgi:carbonic anhydrase/acetyltransferase-like protein (isoleucine patch superfamily)